MVPQEKKYAETDKMERLNETYERLNALGSWYWNREVIIILVLLLMQLFGSSPLNGFVLKTIGQHLEPLGNT